MKDTLKNINRIFVLVAMVFFVAFAFHGLLAIDHQGHLDGKIENADRGREDQRCYRSANTANKIPALGFRGVRVEALFQPGTLSRPNAVYYTTRGFIRARG